MPSQHNTSHDNVGEDRLQDSGGSIANMNADGTFTHAPTWVDPDDSENEDSDDSDDSEDSEDPFDEMCGDDY